MNEVSPMRSVDDHLADILLTVRALAPLEVDLDQAHGTTLAEDVTSPVPLPPFDNSAMDGYAVRADDVAGAPVTLPVIDDVPAGDGRMHALGSGMAVRIMTGAPMPAGADAVVPVEWTDGGTARVAIGRPAPKGNAVRTAGEDVGAGEVVLPAGTRIGPAQLGILAGVGRRRVLVRPRPRVVVISTGAELTEPGTPLAPGQIWESNSYTLIAAVREAGGEGYRAGIVEDDAARFIDQLDAQLLRADLVITSGGVSMGAYEPVKEALARLGTVRFERVAMQPGMPQGFGVVGEDQVPIFTLPGNPVSSFVSFVLFVRPALRKMQGLPAGPPATMRAVTTAPVRSPEGRRSYLRGVLGEKGTVTPVLRQGSHQLAALAGADALIIVPEDVTELPEGTTVEVIPL
ncbi:molybdopterin molybdenumtransferase MoeA [Planobispora takensis]|uniref:Molybdopterin molybdenumtransferase n=2 Tax=Planobispora takensis TaxID=1367882 RepID=A0A8J3SRX1_9ACTN|nr:molybdopterin molybdenumtransferase MoeA [Planobispora takensis]